MSKKNQQYPLQSNSSNIILNMPRKAQSSRVAGPVNTLFNVTKNRVYSALLISMGDIATV